MPTPKLLIPPTPDDNPRWLGDLRVEHSNGTLTFTAQSAKGHDKYDWSIDLRHFLAFAESLK